MLWHKAQGAGGVGGGPVEYIGSVTKEANSESNWDESEEALDVLSIAQPGDLMVIAFSFARIADATWDWQGMPLITAAEDGTGGSSPGYFVGYHVIQSGETNPYVVNVLSGAWDALSIVASVFRNVSGTLEQSNILTNNTGLPDPPPANAAGVLRVITGHIRGALVTDWGAPADYTLAASAAVQVGSDISSTVIAYRIDPPAGFENPGAFTGSGSDDNAASTLTFS